MTLYRPTARTVLALLVACVLLACSDGADGERRERARQRWQSRGPANYSMVWYYGSMIGKTRIRVEVRDGEVVTSSVLQRAWIPDNGPPTVPGTFDRLRQALRSADDVRVSYDAELGYPESVSVDPIEDAIDDEYRFGIESLQPR